MTRMRNPGPCRRGIAVGEAAHRLQVSRVQLSRLLNGRAAMTAVGAPRGVHEGHSRPMTLT